MLRLLREVSFRDYLAAPRRPLLIVGSIAMGIALLAALGIINRTVLSNFRLMLERAAGKAALQITLGTGEVGFDQSIAEVAEADPAVRHAFGMVRGTLAATDGSGEVLQLFGIDLLSDAIDSYDVKLLGRTVDELEFLNDPTAILVTLEFARRMHLSVGDEVAFSTPTGIKKLTVRGLLDAQGLAQMFGGNLAVMDLPAAQDLLGKPGLVDHVDLIVDDGSAAEVRRRLGETLPDFLSVDSPELRGQAFERAISAFQAILQSISLLCLLAAVFIVYNAIATATAHRARDLAILLSVGAKRRTIRRLVLSEAAVLGFLAAIIGIPVGLGLAHLLIQLVAVSMGAIYNTRFAVDEVALTWPSVGIYVLSSIAAGVGAAYFPARKASRFDPVELMRPDYREKLAITSPNRLLLGLWAFTTLLAAGAVFLGYRTQSIAWANAGTSIWWLSAVIVSIPMMAGITKLLKRILPGLFGLNGKIAAESLGRSSGRTGVTTAVIALSLTVAVTIGSLSNSFRESFRNWYIMVGDLRVSAIATEGGWLETPLELGVERELLALPGVERVETYRSLQGQAYREGRIAVVAVSPGFIDSDLFRRQVVSGDAGKAIARLRAGDGIIISENLAQRFNLGVGGDMSLRTPGGSVSFPITAVVAGDFSGDEGAVLLNRERFAELWRDQRASYFSVFLSPATPIDDARKAIAMALGDKYWIKILTLPQALAYHQGMIDRGFAFTYAIQALVIVVTLAGIFDLLTTQVLERRMEIGTLRALGARGSQVRRSLVLEAAQIGIAGALLGILLSIGTSYLWVRLHFRILVGYVIEHHFAALLAFWCVVLAAATAVAAGHLAARRALRQPVLESLRTE